MFNRREAIRWAESWVARWNQCDLDEVLALYRDDVRFESPLAGVAVGSSLVEGKEALRHYWADGPLGIHSMRLHIERVLWDPDSRELAIVYVAELDGLRRRGCDLITLDIEERVVRGEACFGSAMAGNHVVAPRVAIANDEVAAKENGHAK